MIESVSLSCYSPEFCCFGGKNCRLMSTTESIHPSMVARVTGPAGKPFILPATLSSAECVLRGAAAPLADGAPVLISEAVWLNVMDPAEENCPRSEPDFSFHVDLTILKLSK
ncbi:hypothetical protein CHARACLAT_032796 [Characodon lateralis]|uniref:Uncharacterized protein n=1 Tax=Characodon lateralis TaxID=208331 RepID=A0ABU7EZ36_9TELE|nr:hypothetical protein [Characodon lateralis]